MRKNKKVTFLENFVLKNFGVNISISVEIFKSLGINSRINPNNLKRKKQAEINKKFSQITTGKKLKDKIKTAYTFLFQNKTYKGIRHKLKYPARGQRTHTNAKTKKKLGF
jgi:small subunit ribosomal protein S13